MYYYIDNDDDVRFDYLQKFDQSKCFESDDLTQCSRKCLSEAKIDYDAVLAECVKQEELDTDTTNELLEKQLKIWKESPYKLEEMPILEIGGEKFHDHDYFRDDWVLKQWCEKFPPDDQPVSCQYCDTCYRQRRCLWELNCDGGHFDIDTYQIKHHTPSPSSPPTLSPTPAPDKLAANSFLEDSGLALGFGVFIGMVFSGVCFGLAEIRRRKAVAEVAKTLPTEGGFSDEYSFKDEDLELPAVS